MAGQVLGMQGMGEWPFIQGRCKEWHRSSVVYAISCMQLAAA